MSENGNGAPVRCTYCGQRNQVAEGKQVTSARCGRCRLPFRSEPHKKFAQLDPHAYIHPLDSQALAALKAIPGIDTILKKLIEITGESMLFDGLWKQGETHQVWMSHGDRVEVLPEGFTVVASSEGAPYAVATDEKLCATASNGLMPAAQ